MRFIAILLLIALSQSAFTQDLYNNIGLSVKGTGSLFISNSFTNESSATYVNDAKVTINGNITNRQSAMTTTSNTGKTILSGTAVQQLLGTQNFVTDTLNINNTSADASNLVLNGTNSFIVKNDLVFVDGIVATNANNITLNNLATYKNANDTRHVNGFVRKIGNQAFNFPVGDGNRIRVISISAPSVATDAFTGKYLQTSASPLYDLSLKDAVLDVLSTCEYWTLDRTSGTTDVFITPKWLDSAPYNCLGTTPPSDYYVGGWNGATWKSFGNGGTTGTSAAGTIVTNAKPTVYGPFILAKRNIPLPIKLISFDANMNQEGVIVSWGTTNHYNSSHFIVERSNDGINWVQVQIINSEKESNKNHYYTIIDSEYQSGANYYRLTEVSTKGEKETYGVRLVEVNVNENFEWSIFPNPNNGEFIVQIKDNDQIMSYEVICVDILGKELFRKKLTSGNNQVSTNSLTAGTYIAKIKLNNHFETQKIVVY